MHCQVFGNIGLDPEEGIDRNNNFRHFFQAVLLLFRQVSFLCRGPNLTPWSKLRGIHAIPASKLKYIYRAGPLSDTFGNCQNFQYKRSVSLSDNF